MNDDDHHSPRSRSRCISNGNRLYSEALLNRKELVMHNKKYLVATFLGLWVRVAIANAHGEKKQYSAYCRRFTKC